MINQQGIVLKNLLIKKDKMVYHKDESNYYIYSVRLKSQNGDSKKVEINPRYSTFTITGNIGELKSNHIYEIDVQKEEKNKYRYSYKFIKFHYGYPKEPKSQWAFLDRITTDNVKKRLRQRFSEDDPICDIISEGKLTLPENKIKGLGKKSIEKLTSLVSNEQDKSLLYSELNYPSLNSNLIKKIYDSYHGNSALAVKEIKENPYLLINKLSGFGFAKADNLAKDLGLSLQNIHRLGYGLRFILEQRSLNNGNTYESISDILKTGKQVLNVDSNLILDFLKSNPDELKECGLYVDFDGNIITTKNLYKAEESISQSILFVKNNSNSNLLEKKVIDQYLKSIENDSKEISPSQDQKQVFNQINSNRLSILIGAAGTGKTWTIKHVVNLCKQNKIPVTLLAPTGRAAKILSDYTGQEASTIHRYLKIIPKEDSESNTQFGIYNSLPTKGVVIIDEASMIDTYIAQILLKQLIKKPYIHMLLIGDTDQLPSVAPGDVLQNLINSKLLPVVKLSKVYRQKSNSGILTIATVIRDREKVEMPDWQGMKLGKDTILVNEDIDREPVILERIALWYYQNLSDVKPIDIMVLVTKNKGDLGAININHMLQNIANPLNDGTDYIEIEENSDKEQNNVKFRKDDLVYIKRNNYNAVVINPKTEEPVLIDATEDETIKELYDNVETTTIVNGDLGTIKKVNPFNKSLIVKIADNYIRLKGNEISQYLSLGYCLTIHKSQGGQAKKVMVVITSSDSYMLSANLLYTAITRATENLYMICPFFLLEQMGQHFCKRKTLLPKLLEKNEFYDKTDKQEIKKGSNSNIIDVNQNRQETYSLNSRKQNRQGLTQNNKKDHKRKQKKAFQQTLLK